jgi:hypothetical protein
VNCRSYLGLAAAFAVTACAAVSTEPATSSVVLSTLEALERRAELDGKRITLEGYLNLHEGEPSDPKGYFVLIAARLEVIESGRTAMLYFGGDEANVYLDKRPNRNARRELDLRRVRVSGIMRNEGIVLPNFHAPTLDYPVQLEEARIVQTFEDRCELRPIKYPGTRSK